MGSMPDGEAPVKPDLPLWANEMLGFIAAQPTPPTVLDIARGCNVSSVARAARLLERLIARDLIRRVRRPATQIVYLVVTDD